MPATSEANGGVSLRERLLSENHHRGIDARDPSASVNAMSDSVAVLGAEKSTARGDTMPELDDDVQFNYESTFRFMTQRRLQRRYRGVYKQYSFTAQLVTWLIVLYTLLTLATVTFRSSEIEINSKTKTDEGVFTVVVIVVAVYVFVRVALLIRWMVYLVIIAAMVVYAATDEIGSVFWLDRDKTSGVVLSDDKKRARNGIMIALLVAEVLTVAVYYFTHYTYPWLVVNDKFDTTRWWDVKRHTFKGNTLTYRSLARRLYTSKRNLITYCGGLDDEKRPHGFGMWTDTSFHGERLTGHWDHGIPTAPYRSFEHGSGYCFVNVRIGYCHVRAEAQPEQNLYIPQHSSDGLHWGVASVECSVSGGFFTFLPSVRHLTPYNGAGDDTPKNAADCELLLRSPTDQATPHGKTEDPKTPHEVHRRRFTRTMDRRFPSARRLLISSNLDLDDESTMAASGSPVMEGDGKEALIMLHGYNCSLDYAMNRLAQLITLGDFPPHIHPFVFSWPSGGVLAYFQARSIGSQSDETARAFADFVQSLSDAGYTTIHLLAHSMGARVYFHALKKGYLDEVFEHVHEERDGFAADTDTPTRRSRRARLATLTFTNGDYERNGFVARGGGYDLSRRFCRCITVYADGMDGALFYSELLSKESVFGPLNYSMGKRSHMLHRDPDDNADGAADSPAVHDLHDFTPAEMDEAVALVNQRGQFEGVASYAFNRRRHQSSPAQSTDRGQTEVYSSPSWDDDRPLEYLDIDVIDTTWMDNNVHAIRHNYFNLNPTVVEDLRFLMVEQQRASSRPGLLKTTENVYIFLVAPSHIKNK